MVHALKSPCSRIRLCGDAKISRLNETRRHTFPTVLPRQWRTGLVGGRVITWTGRLSSQFMRMDFVKTFENGFKILV